MGRSRHHFMRALQAAGLIFVLVAGLVVGITEPWVEEADPAQIQSIQDVPDQETSDPEMSDGGVADPQVDSESNETTTNEPDTDSTTPRSEQCLDSHNSLAMHIHPRLELVVNNQSVTVPGDLGIDTTACDQAMHLLHTHDASGKLHIEGYEPFTPTADLIFEVWNISYPDDESLSPLFDDATNVTVTVNGITTDAPWHEIELIDGETMRIEHVG